MVLAIRNADSCTPLSGRLMRAGWMFYEVPRVVPKVEAPCSNNGPLFTREAVAPSGTAIVMMSHP